MTKIEEIALRVANNALGFDGNGVQDCNKWDFINFTKSLLADPELLAELSGEAEPVAWLYKSEDPFDAGQWLVSYDKINRREIVPLYIHSANTAAIEQRVAEACAKLCDHLQSSQQFGENGYGCEAAIRSGKWKEYL